MHFSAISHQFPPFFSHFYEINIMFFHILRNKNTKKSRKTHSFSAFSEQFSSKSDPSSDFTAQKKPPFFAIFCHFSPFFAIFRTKSRKNNGKTAQIGEKMVKNGEKNG
jgi:hypothetical protein